MGFRQLHTSKKSFLDILGNHFANSTIDHVKIRPHGMLSENQNTDFHYFGSNLIVERVPFANLSKTSPQKDLFSNSTFLLSWVENVDEGIKHG